MEELEAVTEEAVQHVSQQMQHEGRSRGAVDMEQNVVIAGPVRRLCVSMCVPACV